MDLLRSSSLGALPTFAVSSPISSKHQHESAAAVQSTWQSPLMDRRWRFDPEETARLCQLAGVCGNRKKLLGYHEKFFGKSLSMESWQAKIQGKPTQECPQGGRARRTNATTTPHCLWGHIYILPPKNHAFSLSSASAKHPLTCVSFSTTSSDTAEIPKKPEISTSVNGGLLLETSEFSGSLRNSVH